MKQLDRPGKLLKCMCLGAVLQCEREGKGKNSKLYLISVKRELKRFCPNVFLTTAILWMEFMKNSFALN